MQIRRSFDEHTRHCPGIPTGGSRPGCHFKAAAHIEDLVVLIGQVTYVGNTSMEVRVDTFVEQIDGVKNLVRPKIREHEHPDIML